MKNIHEIISAAPKYLYAGALRVGVSDAVAGVLYAARQAGASEDTVAFLRSSFGDALIRLALAAGSEILPDGSKPPPNLLSDIRCELLCSASAAGVQGVQDAFIALGERVIGQLRGGS